MTIDILPEAKKQLAKLDKETQKRIKKTLDEISKLPDVRSRGKGLTSNLSGLWRYRVNDYRVICIIRDDKFIITVIKIAHRREVYN